mgnify:CR=1 FL=1
MDPFGLLSILLNLALLLAATPLIGGFLARVFAGERVLLSPLLVPIERGLYRLGGVDPAREQSWTGYARSLLLFNLLGALLLYALQRLQAGLPFNPAAMSAVPPDLAFNTAISFVTNTNWQSYGGETTMSLLVQMAGLTVQNFLSAATGLAVAIALIRGFARRNANTIGQFYVDLVRAVLYVLLPLCMVGTLVLVWQGVPQTLSATVATLSLEGQPQALAVGPVASQMMIKHLGTNGGGFFNVNAAHPFESPTALVSLIHMSAIFLLGAGLTNTFGRQVGAPRQGWVILATMGILFLAGLSVALWAESQGNPALAGLGIDQTLSATQASGSLEGKEVRFGITLSTLFAVVTTDASCGAVNAMHDSLMPLTGLVTMLNMMLGEVIIGGVGAGLYGMVVFILLALFIAGLMVGRSPDYLGKKIEAREVKLAVVALLTLPLSALGLGAVALLTGPEAITAAGPHGLSQLLYAYVSATANNGSAFGGFAANSPLHNTLLGLAMGIGRFAVIIPVLAIAGALAAKKTIPASAGTFPTEGGLFVAVLVAGILVVGGLTFFPVLALGPLVEHLSLAAGTLF